MLSDIYLLPINIVQQQERADSPGLLVSIPPKRPARGRGDGTLILFASTPGEDYGSSGMIPSALRALADEFYRTPGSVTSAFQNIINQFNEALLNCNMRDKMGEQVLARLNIGVVRRDTFYIAQAGSTHAYVLNREVVTDLHDPQAMPRSLGMGRSVSPRFFQEQIENGSLFLFCAEPPAPWTENVLVGGSHYSLESLRRRLVHRAPEDIQALIIQFRPGSGAIHTLRRRAAAVGSAETAVQTSEQPAPAREDEKKPQPLRPLETREEVMAPAKADDQVSATAALNQAIATNVAGLRSNLAGAWGRWKDFSRQIRSGVATLLRRMLPGVSDKPIEISPGAMLFIAITVPLVIAAMALTVYFRSGREGEHKRYLEIALNMAVQAQSASDVKLQKEYWNETLAWLDQAEIYGQSDESIALRDHVKRTLDGLDAITRVEALPALQEELPATMHISQMAANGTDVYVLDANEGKVWRLFLTSTGYEVDPGFQCGPDPSIAIDPLVDLVSLPPSNPLNAAVMAMDGRGNLLYCAPGEPVSMVTLMPPMIGWGEIIAFTLRSNNLYVLDRGSNAVWKLEGKDFEFGEQPALYFQNDIPQRLNQVIDLAVVEDELFLLREDGTMISCLYQPITNEVCTDPAPYGDLRPGREQQPLSFADAKFIQMQATSPPDPSIYILDASLGAVYQLSLRLNLVRQLMPEYNPDYPLPQQVTSAFIITPNRILVMAFSNALYFAPVP